ncbi:MAG TPA: HlyD family type I secretion periplasmic adaptor subunit [Desulfobulbaceae bacterium]|nr:HlyD family type I secretion periplasmic adaptor subunit [Desulfobulbaceae bacterium]
MIVAKNETDKSVAAGSADRHLTQLHNSRYKAELDQVTDIRTTILVQSPRGGQLIVWMTLVLTFLLIYWMYVSQIEEITRGTGKVIPSSQLQVVQNLEGGILAETLVREGEVVTKGQLLMRLDETRFSAPYQESRLKYLSLLAKSARLRAENEGGSMQVPEEVVKERPEIAAREQQLFVARKNKLITTIAILEEQEIQRKQELAELEDKLRELDRTYKLLKKEIDMTKPLVAQGAVSEVEILRLDREASTMQGEMSGIRQSIPRTKSKITEARKVIDEERMNFANTAKKELNEVQVELEGLSASATALADRLDRTSVRSPVHGTVKQILVNTVGGVVQPGMDLIAIVPLEDSLLVETQIKPSDIAFLRPQQHAIVKFTAYDFTIYGGLEAELELISADSMTDEKGDSYYLVRVRTRKNYLESRNGHLPIIPGMVATVDIITGKKTILSYLLKPVLRAREMALRER